MGLHFLHEAEFFELTQSTCKHLHSGGLTGERIADDHETVTHSNHLVKLNDLLKEVFRSSQVLKLELGLDTIHHGIVIGLWEHDTREQIGGNVLE